MDTVNAVIGAAAMWLLWRVGGKRRAGPGLSANDIAAGRLQAARDSLLRRDADTAWHILADPAIDWEHIASAVEAYDEFPQGSQLAELVRCGPAVFVGQLQASGTAAAASTVHVLLLAVSSATAVLGQYRPDTGARW